MLHNDETPQTEIEVAPRPTTENGDFIYRVPEQNLEALTARIAKLNKRAAKLKMDPLVLTQIGEEFVTIKKTIEVESDYDDWSDSFGVRSYPQPKTVEYQIRIVLVTVTGKCPRVNGWAMAATIAHDEAGNILRTVPGFETTLPVIYRTAGTICDHCSTNRIRKDTYVLQSETGTWKQVGRNCLADFLRTENAAGLAEMAELLASLDSELGEYEDEVFEGGGRQQIYWNAVTLLTQVACCVRADGWCSRTEARASYIPKQATVDQALECFDPKLWKKLSAAKQEALTPTEDDKARAAAAIAWAQELPADVTNDYLWNIRVVSHREQLSGREAGLAGSIISAYNRFLEREMAKKYERDNPSEYFGTVKEREIFTLTVIGLKELQSDFGSSTLVLFRDPAGNRAKWFSSNCPFCEADIEKGTVYQVKATVKAHEEYRGSKQTLLTRAEIYDAEAEAAMILRDRRFKKEKALIAKQIKDFVPVEVGNAA